MFGTLHKVVFTDHENRVVHALLANGTSVRLRGLGGVLPDRGVTILLGNERWEIVPSEVWLDSNAIAIVREVQDDGRVVIETNYQIKMIANPSEVPVHSGNTIEFNDFDGILSVVSEKPLVSKGFSVEREDESHKYLVAKSKNGLSFDDFGGYPDVVSRARELIQNQLDNRQYLDAMKVRPIRGILLTGPPGTGKTFLARIIAQESDAEFYLVNGPTVISKWLGDTESTLREIFDAAVKSVNGAIIFFDEIDSIAADRSGDTHEASKKLVAQLLTLMDGFDEKKGKIIVIAATNRPETLDPALKRPGRFDWEIEFGIPTKSDRLEILHKSINRHKTASDIPIVEILDLTEGWSAAELVSIIAEAGQVAANDKRSEIAAEDFAQGYERVAKKFLSRVKSEACNEPN